MVIDFLLTVFETHRDKDAIIWKDQHYPYQWLLDQIAYWQTTLDTRWIHAGTVTILEADFSPNSVALLLALIERACIVVPLTKAVEAKKPEFTAIAQGEMICVIDNDDDQVQIIRFSHTAQHELYTALRTSHRPGLVLFSSGSIGESKAAVHDLTKLLEKFKTPRHSLRTIPFLLYDHIGGVNTMFYTLSNGGCIVTVQDRSPDGVLSTVEKYHVELLPVSPTFLNLILISEAYQQCITILSAKKKLEKKSCPP